jgi:PKD repeat protein
MQHLYVGSIGTGSASRSRALTHEVGHWLNLAHTWGNSNEPGLSENCDGDDGVNDTPNTVGWTSCTLSGSSCGSSLDNVENYMEYSYCSKMFTEGQASRMIAALNSGTAQRNQLWQTNNLINTGVNGNAPLCAAQFANSSSEICAGGSVQFTDQSYHNVSSRSWSFPGGTPSSSTEADPVVVYSESGTYPVTLTVSDGSGSLSTTTENLIVVLQDPGQTPPLAEGFESAAQFADIGWTLVNNDGDNAFGITTAAAFSGSKSTRIVNSTSMDGRIDQLISPTMDMSDATDITLSFRYAFARRSSTNDDRLRVFVSNNCGESWSLRKQLFAGASLTTGGTVSGSFIPTGPDQWGFEEITTISASYHVPNFRIRFEFESDGGNNLYIDDININGMPVGIEESAGGPGSSLSVFPNPATSNTQAIVNVTAAGQVRVELVDVVGRTIAGLHDGQLPAGERRFDLPLSGLPSGLYFVRLQQQGRSEAVRFIVP